MLSVLLDTSFCIRLGKPSDTLHQNALDYFQYFLENKIELYLSSIVIAEYSVKGDIADLPLKTMKIIPFDYFDGKTAGEFYSILLNKNLQQIDREKNVVKDDCKLIAQIYNRKLEGYITKDHKSFGQIINPLMKEKKFKIELLDLAISLKEYKNGLDPQSRIDAFDSVS